MYSKGRKSAYGYIILISIGVIVGFSFHFFVSAELKIFGLILPLIVIIFALESYVIHNLHLKSARDNLREVLVNVQKIAKGGGFCEASADFFPEEISELYKTIEALNKSLVEQNNSKDNVIGIINSIALNIELDELLDDMLPKIIEGTKSNWGAFYIFNSQTEKMELKSSFGFTKNIYKEYDIAFGDGFVGVAAQTDKINVITDIPDDTVYTSKTFLGKIKPRSIMTVPIHSESGIVAVLLLASINNYAEEQIEIVKLIKYYMASAITNGQTYERTKRLKNELTFQNQLIQNMNEELESKVALRTMFWSNIINSIVDYAIIAMDEDGYIIMWNKGAEAIKGLSESEVIGKHITETYYDTEESESLERLKAAKRDGKSEDSGWMTRKNGSVIYIHRAVTAIYNDMGEFTGYTTIIRDMTTYKLLEDKAAYFSYLFDLLISGEEKNIVIINDAGIMMKLSSNASMLFERPLDELCGASLEIFLESPDVFRQKLKVCLSGLSSEDWNDKLSINGNVIAVSLSMTGVAVHGSSEKTAIVYIDKLDNIKRENNV